MSVLIKNVLLGGKTTSIYIENNLITSIGENVDADKIIDGTNKVALPGLVNTHTHAAMTLFRGYGDDMLLQEWLETKIWPAEAKLTVADIEVGTKLAILEMIKSGTTTFSDMYFFGETVANAAEEMGIRAVVSEGFIDLLNVEKRNEQIKMAKRVTNHIHSMNSELVTPALGPHAIYTVSKEGWEWIAEYAKEKNILIHFHLSETEKEVKDCLEQHKLRPVDYLETTGIFENKCIAAHSVWLNDNEIQKLAKYNVSVSHNPISNMKLGVNAIMPYKKMVDAKVNVSFGTDGVASNNTLDMFETMKFASLLAKLNGTPTVMPALENFTAATLNGAKALNLNTGEIKVGKLADIILVDLKNIEMIPTHNIYSNLVYSCNGSCVDTTIVNGKALMENKIVANEGQIKEQAQKVAMDLISR